MAILFGPSGCKKDISKTRTFGLLELKITTHLFGKIFSAAETQELNFWNEKLKMVTKLAYGLTLGSIMPPLLIKLGGVI